MLRCPVAILGAESSPLENGAEAKRSRKKPRQFDALLRANLNGRPFQYSYYHHDVPLALQHARIPLCLNPPFSTTAPNPPKNINPVLLFPGLVPGFYFFLFFSPLDSSIEWTIYADTFTAIQC